MMSRSVALGLAAAVWLAACLDRESPVGPHGSTPTGIAMGPIVSNPIPSAATASAVGVRAINRTSSLEVVYLSLPSNTIPNGQLATIHNARTGAAVQAAMAAGGLDPVPLEASAGDTAVIDVELVGGGHQTVVLPVPIKRPPVVVRTDPPPKKRDVPLNAVIVVVFSEPIDPRTLGGIGLQSGGAPVSGHAVLSADGLRVTLQYEGLLTPNADYVLSISTDVRDVSGDRLEQPVQVGFTTGTTVASAMVETAEPALFLSPLGTGARVFNMNAVRQSNGGVAGTFSIFFPSQGWVVAGRVTCLTIIGNEAWVAGVDTVDTSAPDSTGLPWGWRALDNGSAGGVGDQLSLAWPLLTYFGSPEAFCSASPTSVPGDTAIEMFSLMRGDIAVMSGDSVGPPPPPPPSDSSVSRIAYASATPPVGAGGIRVLAADLSFFKTLTTYSGDWNPTWSPDGTRLAFESDRVAAGDGDIYVVNYDGSRLVRLTSDGSNDRQPAWSPDGRRIAFYRNGAIYIMNAADGSGATRVTDNGAHPQWSPDGSKVVFAGPNGHIWVVNVDGSGLTQLTNAAGFDDTPAWAPDGRTIVFQHTPVQSDIGAIYLMNPDGSGVTQLTIGGQTPGWSPDSKRVVYEYYGINVINVDGSGLLKLGNGFSPAWSPVGTIPPPPRADRTIVIAGGDAQSDTLHGTLPQPLSVRVTDGNGLPVPGVDVSWIIDPQARASGAAISAYRARTDAAGVASVTLTLGGTVGTVLVQAFLIDGSARTPGVGFSAIARGGSVASVTVTPSATVLLTQTTVQLTATLLDAAGNITASAVTWTSGAPTVATVDASGLVTAIGSGSATITATAEGRQGSATVQVVAPEDVLSWLAGDWVVTPAFAIRSRIGVVRCTGTGSFFFTPEGGSLGGGTGIQVSGTCGVGLHVSPISNFVLANATIQFSADCSYTGALPTGPTASLSGTVQCGTRRGTWTAVRSGPPVSVSVTPATVTADTGASATLTGRALNATGLALLGRLLAWSSDNPAVATVSDAGVVTGVSPGSATITATTASVSGQASVVVVPNQPASKIAFSVQPGYTVPGAQISPAVQVELRDVQDRRVPSATDSITLTLVIVDGGNSTLAGTKTVAAVAGVATFSDLSVDRPATNYMLTASSPGFSPVTSAPFNVGVSTLVFTAQPSATAAGASISPPVQVSILDAQGHLATGFNGAIGLQVGTNPAGAVLSGTTNATAVAGVATFSDLHIDVRGVGYTLVASTYGLLPVTSAAFDIQ